MTGKEDDDSFQIEMEAVENTDIFEATSHMCQHLNKKALRQIVDIALLRSKVKDQISSLEPFVEMNESFGLDQ